VQTIAILREDRDALQRRVEKLDARIALQEREYLEAPIRIAGSRSSAILNKSQNEHQASCVVRRGRMAFPIISIWRL
jgi:hypothetical protein